MREIKRPFEVEPLGHQPELLPGKTLRDTEQRVKRAGAVGIDEEFVAGDSPRYQSFTHCGGFVPARTVSIPTQPQARCAALVKELCGGIHPMLEVEILPSIGEERSAAENHGELAWWERGHVGDNESLTEPRHPLQLDTEQHSRNQASRADSQA